MDDHFHEAVRRYEEVSCPHCEAIGDRASYWGDNAYEKLRIHIERFHYGSRNAELVAAGGRVSCDICAREGNTAIFEGATAQNKLDEHMQRYHWRSWEKYKGPEDDWTNGGNWRGRLRW